MTQSTRRTLLQTGVAVAVAQALPRAARAQAGSQAPQAEPRFEPQVGGWRTFEVTTTVAVADAKGATQLWLPVPDLENDYQRSLGDTWTGNAARARLVSDRKAGVRMLHAQFPAGEAAPTLALTCGVQTRGRAVDWARPTAAREDPEVLKANLAATELQPVDGVVRTTALAATQGAAGDVEKVRALYDWMVANTWRDPKTRGCGTGDIKVMLESGNLGGKCADLSALFVGMCRSVGVPARDVYGLRVAPCAFGYRELGGSPAKLTGAQHCRAEVYLSNYGWVAMDPADVLKVMRQERPEWIRDVRHPLIAPVNKALFGSWEGNWVGWNTAHDIRLPGSGAAAALPFLMYPQGQDDRGRFDELAPESFRYSISAREVTA
ncbi:transglutaminase-like domain-containing protein [Phenylobacterium sp.]|uniref:transglutaminase-like domain-containing protein n=1 Tax=Phenylobacterium sp. TaxID=1871053 RepID=UPI002E3661A6|nr:transglutaminase-like domain-containing protein [Phenylobacterium sp.]HEX4712843.1 transglutaminase-like domain-containing protein [Phenylobacterium sp.]